MAERGKEESRLIKLKKKQVTVEGMQVQELSVDICWEGARVRQPSGIYFGQLLYC